MSLTAVNISRTCKQLIDDTISYWENEKHFVKIRNVILLNSFDKGWKSFCRENLCRSESKWPKMKFFWRVIELRQKTFNLLNQTTSLATFMFYKPFSDIENLEYFQMTKKSIMIWIFVCVTQMVTFNHAVGVD